VVDVVFCRAFCEIGCAKRGFLRGDRGAFVVNCVVGSDSKSALKNGTAVSFFLRISFVQREGDEAQRRVVGQFDANDSTCRKTTYRRAALVVCEIDHHGR
jgi:hypothetical protein